ncbi:MAG: Na/Pi symporter [Candidatus Omnitrophica bacterium]|nr:Na/Pi symporter [Candidatus Omnitrophota bacterium]
MEKEYSSVIKKIVKFISLLIFLYFFLLSISLLSASFKIFGKQFAEELIRTTANPFVGLFIGILATSIIQSSSTTTSMVVCLVAAGSLTIRNAIPIVMGANIGTTVTNTLVAIGHMPRKEEFRRAFSGSTIHDLFNIICVIILFPIELSTRYLERTASFLANKVSHIGSVEITSPIKVIVKPGVHLIKGFFVDFLSIPVKISGVLMLIFAIFLLFFSLIYIVKITRSSVIKRSELIFNKILGKTGLIALIMGCLFTAIVQSSSITTSLLVPMVASGIVNIEQTFPIVLGANLGTTVTAILAALTGNIAALTIAFAHLIFNVTGIIIIYPIKAIRNIPLRIAKFLGEKSAERRIFAIIYVLVVFFLIPGILIFLSRG